MIHPCDQDLDALDDWLEDLDDPDVPTEQFLRALRSLRASFTAAQQAEEEEEASTPLDDFESAYHRLISHLKET